MSREGDIVGGRFQLGEQVSYQGDPDCTERSHDHRWVDGSALPGCIMGYHCPHCAGPCGMTGHQCEARR